MAEWTTPPTWDPGQLVSSQDMTDYGQGNHQYLYDLLTPLAVAPVSFSHADTVRDNTDQNRKSLGTIAMTTYGNDIGFWTQATYGTGRLRTTRRGTRTTYTTGGVTTTTVDLPDRVERVRTGTRLTQQGLEAVDTLQSARNAIQRGENLSAEWSELIADIMVNLNIVRSQGPSANAALLAKFEDELANARRQKENVEGIIDRTRSVAADLQNTIDRNSLSTYEERTIAGGTRTVETVAPTHIQTTGFVVNQNNYYRRGQIIANFNNTDYIVWNVRNPNNTNARIFNRYVILPSIPAGDHTIALSYIGEMSGLQPRTAKPDPDEVRWSGVSNITLTAREIIGVTRA